MIQEAVVVMTILGCGNQIDACDYVTTSEQTWNTVAACQSAIPAHLTRIENVSYPVLTANCDAQEHEVVIASSQPLPQKSVFDELRANAEVVDLDILSRAKTSFKQLSEVPKNLVVRLKTVFTSE